MKKFLLALAAVGCSTTPVSPPARPPTPVRVHVAGAEAAHAAARYTATVEPVARVDVAFRVGGYIEALGTTDAQGHRRPLDEGDRVTKGQVLARLRPTDYQQRLVTARAQEAEASANLTLARQELQRTERLVASRSVTPAELDSRRARVDSAVAQVAGARARARESAVSLEDTTVRAPMDGVILKRNVEAGALISPGGSVFVVADTRTVKVVFGAPEIIATSLTPGSPIIVRGDALKAPIDAQVTRVAPSADNNARVFEVETELDNRAGVFRTGMILAVEMPRGPTAKLVVPLASIVRSPSDPRALAAYILEGTDGDNGTARVRDITCGDVIGGGVIVKSGIAPGERVVTAGATRLHDGDLATVIR